MKPKRKLKTLPPKDEQPKTKKRKIEVKEVKEAKEVPLEENEDEKIVEEKPVEKPSKERMSRPIDGDPKSNLLWKRIPSLFVELREKDNPGINLKEIKCSSAQILNWWCSSHKSCEDHIWKAPVSSRVILGRGCLFCSTGRRKKYCRCTLPTFKNPDGSYKPNHEHLKRCSRCMSEKSKSEFQCDKTTKDNLTSWCTQCTREMNGSNRAMMRLFLQGKRCQDCGEQNDIVLEFDHVNNNKEKNKDDFKRGGMNALSSSQLCLEFEKTDIVCVKCHRIRTFSRHKAKARDSEESFMKRKLSQKLKLERKCCSHCPNQITSDTTHLFDCDHIDPKTKIEAISEMIKQKKYTLSDVENEIKKCQLLCCNCHRAKTAKDANWRKLSDFSEKLIAKNRALLDKKYEKDIKGNYIHVRPVKF